MNKIAFIVTLALSAFLICTGCEKEPDTKSPYIDELTIDNYPIIDGSTSTLPLNTVIACELMGLDYQWQEKREGMSSTWSIKPGIKNSLKKKFDNVVRSSQTHNSYMNLIDGEADIVLTARTMSADEKKHAEIQGVTLIETPIALDAFIFIINPRNPVVTLTTEDIQRIYTGQATNWTEFSVEIKYPEHSVIRPYIRNPNSGSQELMDLLVMKDLAYYKDLPIYEEALVFGMAGMIDIIATDEFSIGYTVYYYNEYIVRAGKRLKAVGIEGVQPNKQTIGNRSYPYTTEVYAVIRSDTDKSSMTYKIYEWLQTETGKQVISKSGYLLH